MDTLLFLLEPDRMRGCLRFVVAAIIDGQLPTCHGHPACLLISSKMTEPAMHGGSSYAARVHALMT